MLIITVPMNDLIELKDEQDIFEYLLVRGAPFVRREDGSLDHHPRYLRTAQAEDPPGDGLILKWKEIPHSAN